MYRKSGFTLIELLVVIAIIVLLLSIIMPSLSLAKEKAKAILCKMNLKGHHLSMKMYLEDNDLRFPISFTSIVNGTPGPISCQWHNAENDPERNPEYEGVLWPYLETLKSSLCPTFQRFAKFSGHLSCAVDFDPQYSYSQNHFLGSSFGAMNEGQVKGPAGVLLYVEETIWYINEGAPTEPLARWILNDTCFMARHPDDGNFAGDTIATYHKTSTAMPDYGMGNTVFVDGPVAFSDPWDTEVIGGKEFRRSYLLSFPKKGAKNLTIPY